MEAQISPILGMTLLEHLDIYIIIGALGSVIIGGVIGGTYLHQRHVQKKLDSARLVLELLIPLRTDEFRQCQVRLRKGDSFAVDEWKTWRIRYLGHLDLICGLHYYDKILTKRHMDEQFAALIKDVWDHEETRQYIQHKEQEKYYEPLKRWFKEEI